MHGFNFSSVDCLFHRIKCKFNKNIFFSINCYWPSVRKIKMFKCFRIFFGSHDAIAAIVLYCVYINPIFFFFFVNNLTLTTKTKYPRFD